jgi:hypothetical protein
MGFWFLNVVVAYAAIWAISGATDAITTSILAIVGIGSGTLLGAGLIDQPRRADYQQLREEHRTIYERLKAAADNVKERAQRLEKLQTDLKAVEANAPEHQSLASRVADLKRALEIEALLCSAGLLRDLLSDDHDWSFHRVQLFIWTGVMFVMFWSTMVHHFAMPDFDGTMLSLMGISSGTYLGFKFPENASADAK